MKIFKTVISFLLVMALMFVSGQTMNVAARDVEDTAGAQKNSVFTSSKEKLAFVEDVELKYAEDIKEGKIKTYSQAQVNALVEEATFATGAEREKIAEELSLYGVYLFNTASSSASNNTRSDTSDITMTAPSIFYTMSTSTWTITCGGNWVTYDWGWGDYYGNVGGLDGFGVGFTNTSGTYNTYVVSAYAYISDQYDNNRITTSLRSDGDGRNGFGFRLQDMEYSLATYVGARWYGSCVYDRNFSSYNGVATAYYIHTYNQAYISSITFGIQGKMAGVTIGVENAQFSFSGFSSDTTF